MALERLQAGATAGVPDLDRVVVRARRQPAPVLREHYRADRRAVAFERLQASIPVLFYSRLYRDSF